MTASFLDTTPMPCSNTRKTDGLATSGCEAIGWAARPADPDCSSLTRGQPAPRSSPFCSDHTAGTSATAPCGSGCRCTGAHTSRCNAPAGPSGTSTPPAPSGVEDRPAPTSGLDSCGGVPRPSAPSTPVPTGLLPCAASCSAQPIGVGSLEPSTRFGPGKFPSSPSVPGCDVCGAPAKVLTCLLGRRKAMQACATILCPRHLKAANRACARWTRLGLLSAARAEQAYAEWVSHYLEAREVGSLLERMARSVPPVLGVA